jgi:Rrf2 family protein
MKLTRASAYAIQALAAMAADSGHGGNSPIASHLTAQAHGIPERFLLKLLKPLVSAGILQSVRGPGGGYRLARPATKITLLEVIEAVDGPIRGVAPPIEKKTLPLDALLQKVCEEAAEQTRRQLQKVKLSELTEGK